MGLVRSERQVAWELRASWAAGRQVVLTLSERCDPRRLEGRVQYVAVTDAYVVVDGCHVPCIDVLGVHKPHHSQHAAPVG